jgi:hypothetical protein
MLQVFSIAIMVFPSDAVIKAIGASGYVANLVAMAMLGALVLSYFLGYLRPQKGWSPSAGVLGGVWVVSLISYTLMDRPQRTSIELAAADRWFLQLAGVSGIILVASTCLRNLSDVRRVLRALCWGGSFCGIVAGLQFWFSYDITPYLRRLPGFTANSTTLILNRAGVNRVSGTAIHPIELGVVAAMLLPLAIYLAMYDVERTRLQRWIPVALIGIAVPTSVSRSAVLALACSIGVFLVLLPARQRLWGLAAIPIGLGAVFISTPGIIRTLYNFTKEGTSDPSIANRVNNYPMVEALVRSAPWFGRGPATYITQDLTRVLDNEYLTGAIELGIVGFVALTLYFFVPALSAFSTFRRTPDPEMRALCAALGGGLLAGTVCSATFDSLSFPMFVCIQAMFIGLAGCCWLIRDQYLDPDALLTASDYRDVRRLAENKG